ncbi:MAG: DUF4331 family protein [Saprospiraceae bacterium]|nr:DUF4331 family protein [Saprospiraceae bacterium]
MKRKFFIASYILIAVIGIGLMAADHIDAPNVSGTSSDITDYYAFQSPENSNNMVFAISMQGLLSPMATSTASFDESVLTEINIDNDGDNVEDLVIQLIPRDGKMYAFGPYVPSSVGTSSTIDESMMNVSTNITSYGSTASIGDNSGFKLFAGPRDDPFFFDLGAYSAILGGTASGFSDPGADTFAGTNVLSIVLELPKSELGNADSINTWVETKKS